MTSLQSQAAIVFKAHLLAPSLGLHFSLSSSFPPSFANLLSRARFRNSLSFIYFLLYPGLRARFQNRIYRIVAAANSRIHRNSAPARLGLPQTFTKRSHLEWKNGRWERATCLRTRAAHRNTMQTPGDAGSGWGSYYRQVTGMAGPEGGRQSGGRRERIAGFLKSANDLRQSYYQGYENKNTETGKELDDFSGDQPTSSWPEVEVMRSGDEQLVLFPSYARRRLDHHRRRGLQSGAPEGRTNDECHISDEEDDNVVDVDVRGWLFAPHSGPLTRKNRYLHWAALKLCGLPAQVPGGPDGAPTAAEADFRKQTQIDRPPSIYSLDKLGELTRTNSAPINTAAGRSWRPAAISSSSTPSVPMQQLSSAEIASAHSALSARLAPFMHRPIPGTPVTIFFFNSTTSQSRTLVTIDTGHFSARVALPFIPTHVRVLASETLSTTEKVTIHEPTGISLISDIDDTVKHSAVSMGAREIFRNTFTAPLSTLRIPGVADWYTRLAGAPYHVNFHYVSNSPWQLYPVLKSFFEETGLPPGSMHLKQYSGMLQGIFEPVAERKKGTVERVLRDFPERRWILVGDSGEADLEVYTEIVEKFPGKILAVFIRDVTTTPPPNSKGFFNSNESKAEYARTIQDRADEKAVSLKENGTSKVPPPLPPKRRSGNSSRSQDHDEPRPETQRPETGRSEYFSSKAPPPPPKPAKPPALQGLTRTNTASAALPIYPSSTIGLRGPPPSPPPPPLPRRTATVSGTESNTFSSAPVSTLFSPPPSPGFPSSSSSAPPFTAQQQDTLLSKKEELWMRRWENAQMVMGRNHVPLHSWRTGQDVEVICRSVIEEALWGK